MSSLKFHFAVWALGLSVLAGCPQEPASVVCPGTGIICPEKTYCGAIQPICLTTSCGNGIVDLNEQCDDGNIFEGDSCSPICKREECGNNILDPGEVCDDGNKVNADGCNSTCTSKEVCGNSIVDIGEACDDGNAGNADGCSGTPVTVGSEMSPSACKSTEVCGNGIKDLQVGEVCDDGNTVSGDGCNSDCRSGEGCGNGFVDPGEQCDDGNANNNDDCLNTCRAAKCGDGVVDNSGSHGETCDAGTTGSPVETTTCNIDCTTRICGDGKVNQTAGEQCDNGVGANGDTKNCTAPAPTATPARPGCQLNVCGDGLVDTEDPRKEQCDDGNTDNLDSCSNSCQSANCGNSVVNIGEDCDDGNSVDTDACASCHTAVCGDGFVRDGVEECDGGQNNPLDNCSNNCRIERCGNMIIDPGEQCDDGNAFNTDACTNGCQIAVCGDHIVRMGVEQCDDGNTVNADGCSSQCRFEGCGNGTLDPGEQCDDSNTIPGDGCSATCTFEACGDGVINNGEACDGTGTVTVPGVGGETASCNADCTLASCGDAKTNATRGEQCDAGPGLNANDRDCTAMCKINICTDGHVDTKGPNHFEFCDDGNMVATDGCNNSCALASCGNGLLDPGEQCDDNNAVNSDSCNNCQIARCGDGVVYIGVEECDGAANCSANCTIQVCGNGIIDPGEQCDDANLVNGDGCSGNGHPLLAPCKFEFCGDKLKSAGEPCDYSDLAVSASGDGNCNRDCTIASCGDGKLTPFAPSNEECDLGASNGGNSGCTAGVGGCKLEHCGDNNADAGEGCDTGAARSIDGPCLPWCQLATCGDGIVQLKSSTGTVPNGGKELCDLGVANGATTCPYGQTSCSICSATTCQPVTLNSAAATHYCGDATVDSSNGDPETCDNGILGTSMFPANGTSTCPYNTSCTTCKTDCTGSMMPTPAVCGDSVVDGPTEKCDFGPGNNTTTLPATCPYNSSCTRCPSGCASPTVVVSGGRCGDSVVNTTPASGGNPAGPETCDNGAMNTTDVNCPWAATSNGSLLLCDRCSTSCLALVGKVPHFCGDAQCDLGSESPANCSADCGTGQFPLTVVKTGGGDGGLTSSPAGISCTAGSCTTATASFTAAATVTLTAAVDGSSTFVGWGGACVAAGSTPTCTVTMSGALTATANFAKIQRTVNVMKTGTGMNVGTVTSMPAGITCGATCNGSFADGTVLVLTQTPGTNNTFGTWTGCDSVAGSVCIVTVNGTENVSASFTLAQFMVSVTVSTATGTVTSTPAGISCAMASGTCSAMFNAGTNVSLAPMAGTLTWSTDCTGTTTCAFPAIAAPHTVGAAFD